MTINQIKINGFGKLENIELNLQPGINIIQGNNESGKSTLTDFIRCMFYGINKNKAGSLFSDFEKFKPWNENANFSGKIIYSIDNKNYSLYREFSKNNAKIFDDFGLDISKTFNIDKSRGLEIGTEQIKIDEETFKNTILVSQNQIKIDNSSQKVLIQKLTNSIQTGSEDFSYNEKIKKLQKKLMDEVGTNRTSNKPKNILEKEIKILEEKNITFQNDKNTLLNIKEQLTKLNSRKSELLKQKSEYKKVYDIKSKYLDILKDEELKYEAKVSIINEQKKLKEKNIKHKKIISTILILILSLVLSFSLIYLKKHLFSIIPIIFGLILIIINLKFGYKSESNIEIASFDNIEKEIHKNESEELLKLKKIGISENIINKTISNLNKLIDNLTVSINEIEIDINKNQIESNIIENQIKKISDNKDELSLKESEYAELLKKEEAILLSINLLTEAYEEIKRNILPEIEKDMNYTIAQTTNGKYKNIIYNDFNGLVVENQFGELVDINKLSTGTIDQIYLGFRISLADKYNNIFLIFDESFVYSDNERLENILKTISEIAENRQIIILSCSNREYDILKKLEIDFNYILF